MSEYQLQCAVARYLDMALPQSVLFTHIPHGERRDGRTAAKLKRMGVKPGWPDFAILWDPMIFLECKWGKGKLTDAQQGFAKRANERGHMFYEVRMVDDVYLALKENGIPVSAR